MVKEKLLFTLMVLASLGLVSCGHIYTKSEGYAESSVSEINGAKVNAAFKPNGGKGGFSFSAMVYMAGAAKLEGPFLWRMQAVGEEGKHETMTIHGVKVVTNKIDPDTKRKRQEWFPREYLNKPVEFIPYKKTPNVTYAYFQMPGELKVMPEEDGNVMLLVDVSVKADGVTDRKTVQFSMAPASEKGVEFIFLPTEIVNSFSPDPRDWKF